ncbi:TetR family transcriptional regulator [Actinomadura sp. PM05-2]|uniref:TetR family transcriptional regulator n=2 Tax=Actinomadura parmotrematis TaxID=2864039 RepID=A0ABS7G6K0_9ACTN|nr:TetR family transcriptional regulator [Actinomadura parmotrematis]
MPAFKRARRQRIIDAAFDALEGQEYERIRISEIARSADVALGTLYRYFSSKEHLYAVVLREWAERDHHERRRPPPASGLERARIRIHAIVSAFERRPQYFKLNILLQASADPEVQAVLAGLGARARMLLASDFEAAGVREPQDAAAMLHALGHSLLTSTVYHGRPVSETHRLVDRFIDLYAGGAS